MKRKLQLTLGLLLIIGLTIFSINYFYQSGGSNITKIEKVIQEDTKTTEKTESSPNIVTPNSKTLLDETTLLTQSEESDNNTIAIPKTEDLHPSLEYYLENKERLERHKHIPYDEYKSIAKRDRPDLAAMQNFEMIMDPSLGYVPSERKLVAHEEAQRRLRNQRGNRGAISGVEWKERGPNNIAGRVRSVMFDPNDASKKKVWSGSIGGGIWFNNDITDATSSWNSVNDFLDNIAISTLAYDPNSTQTFYAGTGLGFTSRIQGDGIWKSTNGGTSWTQISNTNDNTDFYFVQKIVLTSTSTMLAATSTGIFRSTNGGDSFTNTLSGFAADIELASDGTIYVSQGGAGNLGKVYKSSDDGLTWTEITPETGGLRVELAVAPSNPNYIYAVADGGAGQTDVQWFKRSVNGGVTWTDVNIPLYRDQDGTVSTNHFTRGQAFFDLILAVHPTNPDLLLAGGIDLHRTTDGGNTWENITYWTGSFIDNYAHADHHALMYRPGFNNQVILGTDGGIFHSEDIVASNPVFNEINRNFNVTTFYSIAMLNEANSNYLLAGAQDNGSLNTNDSNIGAGLEVTGGDGGFVFIDQDNPQTQITSFVFNSYRVSNNGGKSFTNVSDDQTIGRFINPSEYDSDANILYGAGDLNQITRIKNVSTNPSNLTTVNISTDNRQITHIKASPYTANRLFIGVRINGGEGKLYRIDNAHLTPTVTEITGTYPGSHGGWISSIDVGATDDQLLATFSNYGINSVYETTDGGATWSNKNGDLPDIPVRWGLYNPNNRNEVLLATEVGVWSTDDLSVASPDWEPTVSGLANVRCDMLKYRSSDGLVGVATFGRGLFTTDIFAMESADFTTKQLIAYVGVPVQFEDNSTKATSWSWDFGNSTNSTNQNPTATYSTAGTYTVSLDINGGGGAKTTSKTNYVTVLPSRSTPYNLTDGGNFEVNPNDFTSSSLKNGVNIWERGTPGNELSAVASGTNAWKTDLDADLGNSDFDHASALFTPSFDFSTTDKAYTLKFKRSQESFFSNAPYSVQVEYTTDGGQTWNVLGTDAGDFGSVNWYNRGPNNSSLINRGILISLNQFGWNAERDTPDRNLDTQYDVSFLKGNSSVAFRFVFGLAGGFSDDGYAVDGFMVDDFELLQSDPVAEFEAERTFTYSNTALQFFSRASGASSFSWDFGDSNTSTDENPTHTYSNPGTYTVTLTIDGGGSSEKIKTITDYITILPQRGSNYGLAEGGNFDVNEGDFAAENIAGTPFERGNSSVSGKSGTASGGFAWVTGLTENEYQDNSEARLYTPLFDFSSLGTYTISFKTNHNFEDNWDGFIVQYSTDKGKSWIKLNNRQEDGWYNQITDPQAVFGAEVPIFSGDTGGEFQTWSTDVSFLGGNADGVAFRFLFLTDANTVEAGMALDDFILTGPVPGPAVPNFIVENNTGCTEQIVTFKNTSTGTINSMTWDFGANASPPTAIGAGPHEVKYEATSVVKNTVKLTVISPVNGTQVEEKVEFITIAPLHEPSFTITSSANGITLVASTGEAFQWFLNNEAIDGATSQEYVPTSVGNYSVAVTVDGCSVTTTSELTGPVTGLENDFENLVTIFPNPSDGLINLKVDNSITGQIDINIFDIKGQIVFNENTIKTQSSFEKQINLSSLAKGVYLVEISNQGNKTVKRIVLK